MIIDLNTNKVKFKELKIKETFLYQGDLFFKLDSVLLETAVNLKRGTIQTFNYEQYVEPIEVKIVRET